MTTIFEAMAQESIEKGLEKGLEKGRKQATISHIELILGSRFGEPVRPYIDDLEKLEAEPLQALITTTLTSETLEDFVSQLKLAVESV